MDKEKRGFHTTRRRFLQGTGAVGASLVVGFQFNCSRGPAAKVPTPPAQEFAPNAFVRVAPDNTVTIIAKHIEFGQGTHTGLATVLAEELDADWQMIKVEAAPADPKRYNNLFWGEAQGTGGSTAMANSWQQMRQAGATARAMLVAAAAEEWGVPVSEVVAERGKLMHAASGKSATFGEMAGKAATMTAPEQVPLKDPSEFKLIGAEANQVPRVDVRAKSRGEAQFTMDVYLPDMVTALIARPPRFGASVASVDDSATKAISGVVEVVQVPAGVAVLAKSFWAAKKGRDALKIEWDFSQSENRSSARMLADLRTAIEQQPGMPARADGDAASAIDKAEKIITAEFEFPYLAHAPMEPLDCVLQWNGDSCEIWSGAQAPTMDQYAVSQTLGITPDKVKINTLWAGGSFGRRATPNGDVSGEAASIAKATGRKTPIKLVWTREDDIRGGRYRPMYVHQLRGGVDASGNIVGWQHRIVGQSILVGTPFAGAIVDGIDNTSVEGARGLPYAIPNIGVNLVTTDSPVTVLWWRAVGHTHTAFSTEIFLDELARAAGRDPFEVRRELLKNHPRHLGVLELAAEKAGWGTPLPEGKARGISVHESFSSFVAQVVEVSLGPDRLPVVERVVCAVDCGIAINPDNLRAQMEGGVGFALSAAKYSEILFDDGEVRQSNFNDYRSLRIHEMPPKVEVHIVPSGEAPTGIGEPGVPPLAPAVANAYAQLTGQAVRKLPFVHLNES